MEYGFQIPVNSMYNTVHLVSCIIDYYSSTCTVQIHVTNQKATFMVFVLQVQCK